VKTIALVCMLFTTSLFAQSITSPAPTFQDVAYGSHERHVLDFWQAESPAKTPLVVFIHGGGFVAGGKDKLRPQDVSRYLDAGISVASINYRYASTDPFPACFYDARRALQFLRFKSREWNIDTSRIGAWGGSAGAMMSMWLAFHDDMATTDSSDPVERESTRLACIATMGGQITFDRHWMEQSIPGNMIHNNPAFTRLFNVPSLADLDQPATRKLVRELSPIFHLTKDDPPIYMGYGMAPNAPVPTDSKQLKPWALHHVIFGVTLKTRMDALGIPAHLQYPGRQIPLQSIPDFFLKQLTIK
jgi:acetyl esterase